MTDELSWTDKYRPKKLENFIGNKLILQELKTLLRLGKLPQTMLFEGEHGMGKTSLAKFLALNLLCPNTIGGLACNTCGTCQTISEEYIENATEPYDVEIYSYNIANEGRVGNVEDIVGKIDEQSYTDSPRVFILDEIQVATLQSQNRLLKCTENPPKNTYIFICTTNSEKLLEPLKGRFLSYKLKKPNEQDVADHLETICQAEGVNYSKVALRLIVRRFNRNIRQAINNTELLSSLGNVNKESVTTHFDIITDDLYESFITACKLSNMISITKTVTVLDDNDIDYKEFLDGFSNYIINLIELANTVDSNVYSVEDVRRYKKILHDVGETQIVAILRVLAESQTKVLDDKFMLYTLAVNIMPIFQIDYVESVEEQLVELPEEAVPEIPVDIAKKNYAEVTEKVALESEKVVELGTVDVDEVLSIFNGKEVID